MEFWSPYKFDREKRENLVAMWLSIIWSIWLVSNSQVLIAIQLDEEYILEDCFVMKGEQNMEHYAAPEQYTKSKDEEAAKTEHAVEPNKEERRRSKRKINKPQYLKDYAMKYGCAGSSLLETESQIFVSLDVVSW